MWKQIRLCIIHYAKFNQMNKWKIIIHHFTHYELLCKQMSLKGKKEMKKVEKILRLTRHPASEEQLAELRRIFGSESEIVEISETVPGSARVRELVEEHRATVLEAVLPLPVLAEIINPRTGVTIPVIRAVMNRELKEDGTVVFNFSHYERILKIEVQTERL